MGYIVLPIDCGQFLIYEEEAAAAVKSGRPLRNSTGASVSGGMECGMGKRRR